MPIAVGQSATITSSSGTVATAGVTTQSSGSAFILFAGAYNGTLTGCSDNKGNSYSQIGSTFTSTVDSNLKTAVFYVENGAGGAGHTFTVSGSVNLILFAVEVTGGVTSGILDQSPAGAEDTVSPYTTATTATTSQANELALAYFATLSVSGTETLTWGNSFTQVIAFSDAINMTGGVGSLVLSSTQTVTGSITSSGAGTTAADGWIVTLKEAGGGGSPNPTNWTISDFRRQPMLRGPY